MPAPKFDRPVAHRGLHNRGQGVIENTRSAFGAAIAKGYAIECDVQITSDGVPVVIHDDETTRLLGRPGLVRDMHADQITRLALVGSKAADHPEPLEAILAAVDGQVLMQIELKRQRGDNTDRLAAAAVAVASSYSGPLVFESFDPNLLIAVRRHGYEGPIGIISERYEGQDGADLNIWQKMILRNLTHWPWSHFDFMSIDQRALSLPAVRMFRALGKPVTSWTIRSADQAHAALRLADQIVFEGFDPDTELVHDANRISGEVA